MGSCLESVFSPLSLPRFGRGPTLASAHHSLQVTVMSSGTGPIRVDLENPVGMRGGCLLFLVGYFQLAIAEGEPGTGRHTTWTVAKVSVLLNEALRVRKFYWHHVNPDPATCLKGAWPSTSQLCFLKWIRVVVLFVFPLGAEKVLTKLTDSLHYGDVKHWIVALSFPFLETRGKKINNMFMS